MKVIAKKNYRMFGKEIYLIGKDSDGIKIFLEEPSWDCGWYWGWGYLETYTNNRNIAASKDIDSHTHFTDFGKNKKLNNSHELVSCVLSFEDLQKLKRLMKQSKKLCNKAQETKAKEFKNLSELFKEIIDMLKPE